MIWIIGEYAEIIENSENLLDSFLENFKDEPSLV
jgi:vesicle coat complex subunit